MLPFSPLQLCLSFRYTTTSRTTLLFRSASAPTITSSFPNVIEAPNSNHVCYNNRGVGEEGKRRYYCAVHQRENILPAIDNLIYGKSEQKAAFVEYIFTKPAWTRIFKTLLRKGVNSAINPYGHSLVRYYIPGELDIIMNISSTPQSLVNFISPINYLFTDEVNEGNQQGGILNRSFLSIRIDNFPISQVKALHDYYLNLQQRNHHPPHDVSYSLFFFIISNRLRSIFHPNEERGNCAYWTSKGLAHINILPSSSSPSPHSNWPLLLWFKILWQYSKSSFKNINIISYRSIRYHKEPLGSLVHPFWGLFSYRDIWNLDSFANIIIQPKYVSPLNFTPTSTSTNNDNDNDNALHGDVSSYTPPPNLPSSSTSTSMEGKFVDSTNIQQKKQRVIVVEIKSSEHIRDRWHELQNKFQKLFKFR